MEDAANLLSPDRISQDGVYASLLCHRLEVGGSDGQRVAANVRHPNLWTCLIDHQHVFNSPHELGSIHILHAVVVHQNQPEHLLSFLINEIKAVHDEADGLRSAQS